MARFYSVQIEGQTEIEIDNFFSRHESLTHLQDSLDEILAWIDGIANRTGALPIMFRDEKKVLALPPDNPHRRRSQRYSQVHFQEINRLRLYLIRFNQNLVMLLNGGEKTDRDPESCPNVRRYFRQAQCIALALDEAIIDGDIQFNPTKTELIFSPNFELQF